ncbi:GntR family transcriptional regulator [Pseudomonas sp. R2.Fl]|nr:GntR family transcriptional regulator [Pseudomonas sp. R2.Fl]
MAGEAETVVVQPGRGIRASLTDVAYERLRREIVACKLEPGREFTELDVAERLEMSKTPVREALMRLQFEGLVKAYPRRGYMVEPIKVGDINDIFDMRVIVEGGAMELAVQRAGEEDMDRLAQLAASVSDELYSKELDRSNSVNNAFHESIALAAQNSRLHRTVVQLLRELERFFYIEAQAAVAYPERYASHKDIVAAMQRRDFAMARTAMIDHIEGTRAVLLASIMDGRVRSTLRL